MIDMSIVYSFECLISIQQSDNSSFQARLQFNSNKINLLLNSQCYEIDISYKLAVKWICQDNKLISMLVQQFSIEADSQDLLMLKKYLDCKVTYVGIREIYDNVILIQQKGIAKTCTLKSKIDEKTYLCKCYKKQEFENLRIYEQLVILRKLSGFKNVAQMIDFFESSNSYYIIFEEMSRIHYHNLSHDDIQSMMFDILCSVKVLISNNIYHSQINLSNILMDKDMNCKFIGFENAQLLNKENGLLNSLMLKMAGNVMMKLYQYNFANKDLICIPDNGNSLIQGLLEIKQNQQLNIDQALRHEYFEYFDNNSGPMIQQQIIPKLKSCISQQSLLSPINSNI
ncbi:unnamed protein product [Paramecium sonneborni]|uniref:Protein kinase domain-containing protein n=1 Tax=Paramecium sonneborni TaxID=65129 RepID=A0A8S1P633_9CILI|nr:unnamed protein product [Paramecium sonneborni]